MTSIVCGSCEIIICGVRIQVLLEDMIFKSGHMGCRHMIAGKDGEDISDGLQCVIPQWNIGKRSYFFKLYQTSRDIFNI